MAADKREQLLFDEFINLPFDQKGNQNNNVHTRKSYENMQSLARKAKVFAFDTAATIRLGNVIKEVPDLLVKHQQFAIAPYDLMWIEYKFKDLYQTVNDKEPDFDASDKVGFLLNNGSAHEILGGCPTIAKANHPFLSSFRYDLHLPWEVKEQLEFCRRVGTSREQLDFFFWGSATKNLKDIESLRGFRAHHSTSVMPMNERITKQTEDGYSKVLGEFFQQQVGSLRNLIAALLLINRPGLTKYVQNVPREKRFSGGKLRPYAAHTVVTIDLDPVPQLQLIGTETGDAIARRRHEVRGHFAHDATARQYMRVAGCNHDWQTDFETYPNEDPLEPRHWKCVNCGGRRWWRKEHHRGDATLGFVIHDGYSIEGQPRSTED